MKFNPSLGESDFRKLRKMGAGYVDKTDFLCQVLADTNPVLLFSRPRRFGKTLNLSTLGYFLRKTDEDVSGLFEGLKVTRDPAAMAHFQRYPTAMVTFKDANATSFADALEGIGAQIAALYEEHAYLLTGGSLPVGQARSFERILAGEATRQDLQRSLYNLSQMLLRHHGREVVLLIDEYDTPILSGYQNGFFEEIVLFFRNLLSAALKDNSALFKSVLTGILRVSKENLFSGLNNIQAHSILSSDYATSFGFTEEEVASIVDPARLEEVRSWYNGYLFGGQVIYNPWSVLSYIRKGTLAPYWVNTASNDLIEHLATKQGMGLSANSVALLNGETIDVPIQDDITLRDIDRRPEALWNFLLFSGYLKLANLTVQEGRYTGSLCIPNKEIQIVYEDMFQRWLAKAAPASGMVDELVRALLDGEANTVEILLREMLLTVLSYQDGAGRDPEKLYHGFILGLLVHLTSRYAVRSNREAGYGRADVLMIPKSKGPPGVVMELKVPFGKETPKQAMEKAVQQVRLRRYAAELSGAGVTNVIEYGVVFDGKSAWVRRVEEPGKKAPEKGARSTSREARPARPKRPVRGRP